MIEEIEEIEEINRRRTDRLMEMDRFYVLDTNAPHIDVNSLGQL